MRRLWEAWLVWLLFGLTTVAVFVTYWRLPPTELWKTSQGGFVGGISRAFVFLSFSAAVVAPAVLAIVWDRLEDRRARALARVSAMRIRCTSQVSGSATSASISP